MTTLAPLDAENFPEFGADWMDRNSVALQVDGNDLVHIHDIDPETGVGRITVFSSSHPDATVIFVGTINVLERKDDEEESDEQGD